MVAHERIDPARGGAKGLAAVSAEARRLGMGVLVDIVPNHVGVATAPDNAGGGTCSGSAGSPRTRPPSTSTGRPATTGSGSPSSATTTGTPRPAGSTISHVADGELRYHDHRFPLAPGSADDGAAPNTVHDRQHYELVHWKVADDGLNYRRFFAVNTLAAIRVEDPQVLADSHVEIRRWFDEGLVDGLRVDHPDGLRDPRGYLDDLAAITGGAYVLVEKILEPGERLSPSWATAGTTGYDALGLIDRVLTDPQGHSALDALEARLRGEPVDWQELIHGTKRAVADGILRSEVNRITREIQTPGARRRTFDRRTFDRLSTSDRRWVTVAEKVATRWPSCWPASRSTAPTSPRAASTSTTRSPLARSHRPDLADVLDVLTPVLRRSRLRTRPAVPADQRHGDGQGGRGLRVLPLLPAHLAQRGRRRPERVLAPGRRLPHADDAAGRPSARTR